MPIDQLAVLTLGLILIGAVAGTLAYAISHAAQRGAPGLDAPRALGGRTAADDPLESSDWTASGGWRSSAIIASGSSTRQVARVVAFLFLASVAVVVALTQAWPDTEAGVFTLLAAGTLLVVLFMDMLPPAVLGWARRPVEGLGAIVFLGLLMGLTGGIGSPFVVGFFLVVAGTALSTEGLAPLLMAVVAAVTIAFVGTVVSTTTALDPAGLAWVGATAVTLVLLADLAAAAARAQRQARDEALRASRFDALTGLYNRAFFFTTMEQEIRRSERMGRGFAMLMLDLDDLKPVNDTFGHQWGDRLLKAVADVLRRTIRFTDAAARYGGDEFVVLLPETDAPGGYIVAETLRRDISALSLRAADRNVRSSVSIGLVTYPDDGTSMEQLVAAADVAMYEAKRRGKNQIVGYRTRTERVATAMDVASAEPMTMGQEGPARTGGDVAPWSGAASAPGMASAFGGEPLPRRSSDARRGSGSTEVERQDDDPRARRADGHQEAAGADDMPTSTPTDPESRASRIDDGTRSTRPDDPRHADPGRDDPHRDDPRRDDPTGRGPFGPIGADDAPWLTHTDAPPVQPDQPADEPRQRPAAERRSPGREPSRGDEIRRTPERPWIALPIEPWEPPEPPQPGARPRG